MSPNRVFAWMRLRWYVVATLLLVVAGGVWLSIGALHDSDERRATRQRIEASANEAKTLAKQVKDQAATITAQGEDIKRVLALIESATSTEARARGDSNLAYAIGELRRSIDCTAFYFAGERPAACTEVAARLDAIRSGLDPFPKPPPSTPSGGPQ